MWCKHYIVNYNVIWYKKTSEDKRVQKALLLFCRGNVFLDLGHLIMEATSTSRDGIENIPRKETRTARTRTKKNAFGEQSYSSCTVLCVQACVCMCVTAHAPVGNEWQCNIMAALRFYDEECVLRTRQVRKYWRICFISTDEHISCTPHCTISFRNYNALVKSLTYPS